MKYVIGGLILIVAFLSIATLSKTDASTATPLQSRLLDTTAPTGREPMRLPANYRENLVHYATVDRVDGMTRNLYITQETLDAIEADTPIPDYTVIVIEAFHAETEDGRFVYDENNRYIPAEMEPEVHMAEFRSTWRIEDLAASSHVGGWNFGAFDFETGVANRSELADCFSCHEAAVQRGFLFSESLLRAYIRTGQVQYDYCGLPERSICR